MGVVAEAALGAGGEVVGVIPRALLEREIAHTGLPDLRVVGSMHERKALMSELSEGFIALPGGTGTLEEFFEVLTWAQLGEHRKPCGLLNAGRYYGSPARRLRPHGLTGVPERGAQGDGSRADRAETVARGSRRIPPAEGRQVDRPGGDLMPFEPPPGALPLL